MSAEHFVSSPSGAFSCLPQLLEIQARRLPDAPALLAPERPPLAYGRLWRQVEEIGSALRSIGIGRRDRIALMLPNGPEMVAAILGVSASAVCAPMNPAYGAAELERYFIDLRPRAFLTAPGFAPAARRTARSLGIQVVELEPVPDAAAGLFTLATDPLTPSSFAPAGPEDVALLLFTSGTTARPKIVALTHANICRSAGSTAAALALGETDRCLNVLPLFHGHGLIATAFATLAGGGSLVAAPGCDVEHFFGWLARLRPTWFSAVPTMHQAILARAPRHRPDLAACRLRLVRSASAPLPPPVLAELERRFETVAIEFYGMTETASSPIACNPLRPGRQKAGSVGLPVDLAVAVIDADGKFLPTGQTGEVVVRGASITPGYDGDAAATRAAFLDGWFKTGDLGFFDADGYLFLSGRSKEIINRGGEKIAPREVDEILLEHPAVAEAVAFAVPHPTLGEDVAAAVVLRRPGAATPAEMRNFVIGRLADCKVPRQVLVVDRLPKGPTGKVNRIGLWAALGVGTVAQASVAPRTPLQELLAERWAEILKVERVGIDDDFFALGGDSLLVAQLAVDIHRVTGLELDVSRFFAAPTIAETARRLERTTPSGPASRPASDIRPVARAGPAPASIGQERLWQLQRALRGRPFLNVFCPLRLTVPVDAAVLERSIDELVRRHEMLRTSFASVAGRVVQVVAPRLTPPLACDDLSSLPASRRDEAARRIIEEAALGPFDLAQGPLFRVRLVRLAEQRQLLLVTLHGIVADAWSQGVFVEELFAICEAFGAGAPSPLPPLPIQYADFAQWQQHWRSQPDIVAQLDYWRTRLCEPLPAMRLATPAPRQAIDRLLTARRNVRLSGRLLAAARSFGRREGGTLYMVLVAALKALLRRHLDEDDLLVATLVANRNRPETARLIGLLANTVMLRTNLGGDPSLREVMRRVRTTLLAAFDHQDLPFEELLDALGPRRAGEPPALSRVMIALNGAAPRPMPGSRHRLGFEQGGANLSGPLAAPAAFDLSLMLREGADGVAGSCVYKPQLFDTAAIDRLLRNYRRVLRAMATEPDRRISEVRLC